MPLSTAQIHNDALNLNSQRIYGLFSYFGIYTNNILHYYLFQVYARL